jgi:hypothetical protein
MSLRAAATQPRELALRLKHRLTAGQSALVGITFA